jgi:hypothetical protein
MQFHYRSSFRITSWQLCILLQCTQAFSSKHMSAFRFLLCKSLLECQQQDSTCIYIWVATSGVMSHVHW